jgi:CDP-diacylglycerol---glycerol-3-phosphate 3-phosphatidyltransferase
MDYIVVSQSSSAARRRGTGGMTMTLYSLKPRFQAVLRPLVGKLASAGVTANQVTIAAALGSVLLGALLAMAGSAALFLLLPPWLFLRMALNAVDGMLAREFGQKSDLGAYLNELGDLVSDAALYLPFALIAPFTPMSVVIFVMLALLSEVAGMLGVMIGASRRYDGPMGKIDRALVCGALGLWVGLAVLPAWAAWIMPLLSLTLIASIFNRVRAGLAERRGR